jgi:hypothetical protein
VTVRENRPSEKIDGKCEDLAERVGFEPTRLHQDRDDYALTFRSLHVDVFTDVLFGGNEFAVFPNARDPAPMNAATEGGIGSLSI